MSMDHKRWDDNGMTKALKFWPLVTSILVLTFALGISSQTINVIEKKIDHESEVNDRQEKQIAALEEATTEMIEIKRDIKELLRRVR